MRQALRPALVALSFVAAVVVLFLVLSWLWALLLTLVLLVVAWHWVRARWPGIENRLGRLLRFGGPRQRY